MLDQRCSPGEPGAVGRQHDQVSFFDVAFVDGVDVIEDHVGFLQMTMAL